MGGSSVKHTHVKQFCSENCTVIIVDVCEHEHSHSLDVN